MAKLSIDRLNELLDYDPVTGKLVWKRRARSEFSSDRICNSWNAKHAGKEALTTPSDHGYLTGRVNGRPLRAHRVIWAMVHGYWPDEVDHENGIKCDNRISNLRDVDSLTNSQNCSKRTDNTSGVTGVSFNKADRKWRAYISVRGKVRSLGFFDEIDDAVSARKRAEVEFGYHENHGRMAA